MRSRPARIGAVVLGGAAMGVALACTIADVDETGKECSGERCPGGLPCVQGRCGGSVEDTDGSVAADASTSSDAGVDAPLPPGSFTCDLGQRCTAGEQVCCDLVGCGKARECVAADAAASCPISNCGAIRQCDDTLDCAGGGVEGSVCCASVINGSRYASTLCTTLADCQAEPHAVVCDPAAASPCPLGRTCSPPEGGAGWSTCEGL